MGAQQRTEGYRDVTLTIMMKAVVHMMHMRRTVLLAITACIYTICLLINVRLGTSTSDFTYSATADECDDLKLRLTLPSKGG